LQIVMIIVFFPIRSILSKAYLSIFAPTEILTGECYIRRAATWWITGRVLSRSPAMEY
jgi:hypothetical protein